MKVDVELGVQEVLNLLFLPGFTFLKEYKMTLSLLIIEFWGRSALDDDE